MVKGVRGCVVTARSATEEQRERQGIEELMGELNGQVEGLLMGVGTWQQGRVRHQSIEGTTTSTYLSLLSGF